MVVYLQPTKRPNGRPLIESQLDFVRTLVDLRPCFVATETRTRTNIKLDHHHPCFCNQKRYFKKIHTKIVSVDLSVDLQTCTYLTFILGIVLEVGERRMRGKREGDISVRVSWGKNEKKNDATKENKDKDSKKSVNKTKETIKGKKKSIVDNVAEQYMLD